VFERSSCQPSTTPGTLTDKAPRSGISARLRVLNSAGVAADGARPLAFKPPRPFRFRIVDDCEEIAVEPIHRGLDDGGTAAAVTAASMALPLCWRTRSPAADASG
jgi:hypothetical protein